MQQVSSHVYVLSRRCVSIGVVELTGFRLDYDAAFDH